MLHPVPIAELRPTQITVGMREVKAKQKSWQQSDKKKKAEFLGRHMIPVIRGPKDRLYVIDHHHLSLALHNEGVKNVLVIVGRGPAEADRRRVLDLSRQSQLGAPLRRSRPPARFDEIPSKSPA